jgi:starch synthase
MMASIRYAEQVYYDHREAWEEMIARGMEQDYSWKSSALQYQELYDWLVER